MSISQLPHAPSHARAAAPSAAFRRERFEPSITLVRDDVYAVLDICETMGFVERVGSVYVALSGERQIRAVEVGQSLSWDVAVEMVCLAHHRGRRANPS
ncbi:hypothetical protein SAMN06296378_2273 [Salinibacterium xinjiangense]|uniref:Uncharacterized protein n=2 Tax=Salinibacterium xinjiangense TaxID=386302 RepID=A0A2C8ZXB4_9MICO|nr:hypothetical protein [Salinibacterium xinjiangense]SOE70606.1 hypothetical protein SAMN06296378_2273 [Salinibacterium xinjiangense]